MVNTQPQSEALPSLWHRLKRTITLRILHLDDTPHRIAFGVFLGFVVGWSPTMGAQILLYLFFATILRANRASGILPVLMTNPITAVPVYVFNWRVGRWLIGLFSQNVTYDAAAAEAAEREKINRFFEEFSFTRLFEAETWSKIGPAIKAMGVELVVGCLVIGLICGIIGYIATYFGVKAYRRHRELAQHHPNQPAPID